MPPLFETVHDLSDPEGVLRRRRYGVVEVADEAFVAVRLRPLPKLISLPDLRVLGEWAHRRNPGNRCRLYYNQPRRFPGFLTLKYVVTYREASLATFQLALRVLDHVARLKRSDALLCDVANLRISDRIMRRYGWEPHAPRRWHRNYIKRFYGTWPETGFPLPDEALFRPPQPAEQAEPETVLTVED